MVKSERKRWVPFAFLYGTRHVRGDDFVRAIVGKYSTSGPPSENILTQSIADSNTMIVTYLI